MICHRFLCKSSTNYSGLKCFGETIASKQIELAIEIANASTNGNQTLKVVGFLEITMVPNELTEGIWITCPKMIKTLYRDFEDYHAQEYTFDITCINAYAHADAHVFAHVPQDKNK